MKCCSRKKLQNIDETYFRRRAGKTYYIVFACVALVFGLLSFFVISAPKAQIAHLNLTFVTPRIEDMHRIKPDVPLSMLQERSGQEKLQHLQEAMSRACNMHPFSAVFAHNFGMDYNIFYVCGEDTMRVNAHLKDYAAQGEQTCVEGYASSSRTVKRSSNILYSHLDLVSLTNTDVYSDDPKKTCVLFNAIGLLSGDSASKVAML